MPVDHPYRDLQEPTVRRVLCSPEGERIILAMLELLDDMPPLRDGWPFPERE